MMSGGTSLEYTKALVQDTDIQSTSYLSSYCVWYRIVRIESPCCRKKYSSQSRTIVTASKHNPFNIPRREIELIQNSLFFAVAWSKRRRPQSSFNFSGKNKPQQPSQWTSKTPKKTCQTFAKDKSFQQKPTSSSKSRQLLAAKKRSRERREAMEPESAFWTSSACWSRWW